jgi:methyltransferase FkbM-like protein
VDLLKLDVEGSEHAILEDLEESDKLREVDQIILEYYHHVQTGEDVLGRFLLLLERSGFGYHIRAPLVLPFPKGETQDFMMNAYMKKSS